MMNHENLQNLRVPPPLCQVIQAVTFSSPSWISLSLSKRSLNHPKKITKNCQVHTFFLRNSVMYIGLGFFRTRDSCATTLFFGGGQKRSRNHFQNPHMFQKPSTQVVKRRPFYMLWHPNSSAISALRNAFGNTWHDLDVGASCWLFCQKNISE